MLLAQDDKMVHTLAPDRSDQSFDKAVLPRRSRRRRFVPDAHGAHSSRDNGAIDPVPIPVQVARSTNPRECLSQLACDPFSRRICCDVDSDQVSAVQPNDNEGIEQVEAHGRDNEQIHGGNVRRMVTQKDFTPLARRRRRLTMYLATLDCATSNPSLSSSPWMRGAPQSGFSIHIRRISTRRSASICGRPPRGRDFQRQ